MVQYIITFIVLQYITSSDGMPCYTIVDPIYRILYSNGVYNVYIYIYIYLYNTNISLSLYIYIYICHSMMYIIMMSYRKRYVTVLVHLIPYHNILWHIMCNV